MKSFIRLAVIACKCKAKVKGKSVINIIDGFKVLGFSVALMMCVSHQQIHAQNEQTWTVNFNQTDIQELIRFVAEKTQKTIVIDPKVKGKVQVVSSKAVNNTELYDLFLSILEVHGFAAVQSGNVLRVIPVKDARSSPVKVSDSSQTARPNSEVITHVIQLDNIAAAKLIPVLRPLVPQQGHMAAYAPSNAIIISDTAANIARIREVIDRIDKSAVQKTSIIKLDHASAEDVVRIVDSLTKRQGAKGQPEDKQVYMVADARTNSVLISGDELERERVTTLIRHLDSPLKQSGNVRVIYLEYAQATDLAQVLTKVVQNVGSASGEKGASVKGGSTSIEADEDTNSLIITGDATVLQSLESVIARLDIRRAQVLVEAIIVEISDTDNKDLGIEWLFFDEGKGYGSSSLGTGSRLGSAAAAFALNVDDDDRDSNNDARLDLASSLASTPGQVFGFGDLDNNSGFSVVLSALQSNNDANILSTPSLLTLDNEEASIVVGQEVPFVTGSFTNSGGQGSTNPFQTIERQDVGTTLSIIPHINEGDSLVLEVSQEVSSVTGASGIVNASDVITNQRKIDTSILVRDGQVVVLGGLIRDDIQDSVRKVPILGSIPVLGRLFRSNSTNISKENLLVFLRATIVRDDETLDGATAEKYSYIRDRQLERFDRVGSSVDSKDLPLLPEWQQQLERLSKAREGNVIDLTDEATGTGSGSK